MNRPYQLTAMEQLRAKEEALEAELYRCVAAQVPQALGQLAGVKEELALRKQQVADIVLAGGQRLSVTDREKYERLRRQAVVDATLWGAVSLMERNGQRAAIQLQLYKEGEAQRIWAELEAEDQLMLAGAR